MLDRIRKPKRNLLADTAYRAIWGCAVAGLMVVMFDLGPTAAQDTIRIWLHEQLARIEIKPAR